MATYDVCVFAGRFRPFHAGHLLIVREALKNAQYAFVIVGSINEPINFRNPFTFAEVREMIRTSLSPEDADRVFILGIEDQDTDLKWVTAVQAAVTKQLAVLSLGISPQIALIGYSKDESSYYLKLFPQWGSVAVKPEFELDATVIRDMLYKSEDPRFTLRILTNEKLMLPRGTALFLREWIETDHFERMQAEALFMESYLDQFQRNPYTDERQTFTCADACVIQSGHVLLVMRDALPGKGLWALPGGHVHENERFKDAAIRELCEETAIDEANRWSDSGPITRDKLRAAVRGVKFLDDPWRSTRKRTISMVYGIHLTGTTLPEVKGKDDAKVARMWPLDEITREMMFEDHFNVIQHFANQFSDL